MNSSCPRPSPAKYLASDRSVHTSTGTLARFLTYQVQYYNSATDSSTFLSRYLQRLHVLFVSSKLMVSAGGLAYTGRYPPLQYHEHLVYSPPGARYNGFCKMSRRPQGNGA